MPKQEKKKPKTTFKTLFHQWNTNERKQEKKKTLRVSTQLLHLQQKNSSSTAMQCLA